MKKKLQKKANISNRIQNIYSKCPLIAPLYGTLNLVVDENNPMYTPSLAIDGTSVPQNEPVAIKITREITSVTFSSMPKSSMSA